MQYPTPSSAEFERQTERHNERWRRRLLSFVIGSASIHVVSFSIIVAMFIANIIGFIGTGLLVWPMIGIGVVAHAVICEMLNHERGVLAMIVVAMLSFFVSYQFLVPYWQQMFAMGPLWRY